MASETSIEKRENQDLSPVERLRPGRTYLPNVDIVETDEKLLLLADMPGVRSEDLDVRYERGELTITGRVRPRSESDEQRNFLLREYGVGDFHRVFRVGEGVDSTGIEAELNDGVLTLHLPKTQAATPRKINVKAN